MSKAKRTDADYYRHIVKRRIEEENIAKNILNSYSMSVALTQLCAAGLGTKNKKQINKKDTKKASRNSEIIFILGYAMTSALLLSIAQVALTPHVAPGGNEPPKPTKQTVYDIHLDKQGTVKVADKLELSELKTLLGKDAVSYLDDNITNFEVRDVGIIYWSNGDLNTSAMLKNMTEKKFVYSNNSATSVLADKIKAASDGLGRIVETSKLEGIKPKDFRMLDPWDAEKRMADLEREGYFNKTFRNDEVNASYIQELMNVAPGLQVLSPGLNTDPTAPYYVDKFRLFDSQDNGANRSDDGSLVFAWNATGKLVKTVMLDKNNTEGWVLYDNNETSKQTVKSLSTDNYKNHRELRTEHRATEQAIEKMAYKLQKRFGDVDNVIAYDTVAVNGDQTKQAIVAHAYRDNKVVATAVKLDKKTIYFSHARKDV